MRPKNKYLLTSRKYITELNIFQKINARQHRNGLNINYLFGTTINNINMGHITAKEMSYPPINNGLYHHIGKTHSKYPQSK